MKLIQNRVYELKKPLNLRNTYAIWTVPEGTRIGIQQVDNERNKYLVQDVWVYYKTIEDAVL